MRLTILDRYILRSFWGTFLAVLIACVVVVLLTQVLDEFQDILHNQCPLDKAVLFFILNLPFRIVQILPLVTILGVLFSIGMLAHKREMLAITAAGLSPMRVAAPLLGSGLAISLLSLAAAEIIVPRTQSLARFYRKTYIQGKTSQLEKRDVFARGENRGDARQFYILRAFKNREREMVFPSLIEVEPATGRVTSRLTATRGVLEQQAEDGSGRTVWRFEDVRRYSYNDKGRLVGVDEEPEPIRLDLEANLDRYLATQRQPEEMSLSELKVYIAMLESHNEPADRYRTDLWLKLLFPFTAMIFAAAGFAFAMRGQVGALIRGFTMGILFAVFFYAAIAFAQAFGHRDVVPALAAIAIPMILFAVLSVALLRRSAYIMT